jgi:hypothetical protein
MDRRGSNLMVYHDRLLVWMKQYFSYIVEVCFNSGWNLSTGLQKTTDLTQVTDRLFHIMLYVVDSVDPHLPSVKRRRLGWSTPSLSQTSSTRLGRCGSTEWTMFDWRKVWVNRAKNLWLTLDKYRVLDRDEKISFLQQLQCARLLVWMKQYFSYITTNVVCSNPAQARCTRYNIMW